MKKILLIITISILMFFSFNTLKVNAYEEPYDSEEEYEVDFEYIHVTYEFINSSEYYLTYEFKPKELDKDQKYIIRRINVKPDAVEHNLNNIEIAKDIGTISYNITFSLDEDKEYYIKYKEHISNGTKTGYNNNGLVVLCYNEIRKLYGEIAHIDSFKFSVINSKKLKLKESLKKEDFNNRSIDNLRFVESGENFTLEASKDYENIEKYYDTCFSLDFKVNLFMILTKDMQGIMTLGGILTAIIITISYPIRRKVSEKRNHKKITKD